MARLKPHLPQLSLWTVIWFAFFATIILGWERLPHSDFSGQFYAYAQYQARALWAGNLPLWSPGGFGGVPFIADPQAAFYYLPRWLTILLSGPSLTYYALEIEALLHIWGLGVGTYFLAAHILSYVKLDGGQSAAKWGGLAAAVTFALGGYITAYPLLQLAILETWTWLPWALLLLRQAIQPESVRVRPLLASALVMGLAITAGHPQTALHIGYLWGGYFLFLAWRAGWGWRPIFGRGALLVGAALGVSAAAWLPVVRYWPYTVRLEAGYDFVSSGQITINYLQAFLPGTLTRWSPEYLGLFGLGLALLAWFGRRFFDRLHHEVNFWAGSAVLALWLSLGDKGIIFQLWYWIAPGFQLFRQQERLVGAAAFAGAILAGIGLFLLLRSLETDTQKSTHLQTMVTRSWLAVGGGLLFTAVFLLIAAHLAAEGWAGVWVIGVGWWVVGIGWWVVGKRVKRGATLWPVVLILFGAGDLFLAARPGLGLEAAAPDPFWVEPAWLDTVRADGGRFDPGFVYFANVGEALDVESVRGITPLKPRPLADMERLPLSISWPLLGVNYGIFIGGPPADINATAVAPAETSLIPGETIDGAELYVVNQPIERLAMRYEAAVAADESAMFDLMVSEGFDPYTQVALTAEVAALYAVEPPPAPPIIKKLSDRGLHYQVDTESAGYLTISEWFLPGWRLRLNGQRVDPLSANLGLMAIWLPAGSHEITLAFQPAVAAWGIVITVITTAVLSILAWRRGVWLEKPTESGRGISWPFPAIAPPQSLSPTAHRWLLFIFLFSAFALRLSGIDAQELRGDEAFSYLFANKPLGEIVPDLISEADPHPPLHYLLLGGWIKAAGDSELSMRLPSALVGMLALPFIYLIGLRLWNRHVALLAFGLAAFSPSLIWLAQDIRNQYTLILLFTTIGAWLLLSAEPVSNQRERKIGRWFLYALFAALAMYSHYYAFFALLSHGLFLWLTPERRYQLKYWAVSGILATIAYLPWLWALVLQNAAQNISGLGSPRWALYAVQIMTELSFGGSFGAEWIRWGGLGVAFLAVAGWRGRQSRENGEVLLAWWLVLAALGIYLILFRRSLFNAYYIAAAAPAWLLLAAAGMRRLWHKGGVWPWVTLLIIGGWGVGMGVSLNNYYFDPAFTKTWGYRETAAHLAAEAAEGDLFIAHFPDPNFDYYFRKINIPRTIAPPEPGTPPEETEAYLRELAADHERLWFVPAHRSSWDPDDVAFNWLAFQTLREQATTYNRLELLAFRPLAHADQVMTPLDRALGELMLEGVYVTIDGRPVDLQQPPMAQPGQAVQVTLKWSTAANLDASYTMFVHLLAADGRLITQHDGIPVSGTRPTNLWLAGDQILDVHELVIPEDGGLAGAMVVVGAYQTETVERLRFASGEDGLEVLQFPGFSENPGN